MPIEILDDPLPFNREVWIGKGKQIPDNPLELDQSVVDYCETLLEIPSTIIQHSFLSNKIPVKAFISFKMPKSIASLAIIQPACCFRPEEPNDDGSQLAARCLPSQEWVAGIFKHFRQAVLDGNISVEDPHYPGSRLPFWSITFWREMQAIATTQKIWRNTLEWIDTQSEKAGGEVKQLLTEAHLRVETLRWREHTKIPGAPTFSTTVAFTSFLSDNRMASRHLDMMFSHLSERAEANTLADKMVVIETLRFMDEIERANSPAHWNAVSKPFMRRLEKRVENNKIVAMVFPVFMAAQKHWIAIRIDFDSHEITYGQSESRDQTAELTVYSGDSLNHRGMEPPKVAIRKLKWWLEARFRGKYKDCGDQLMHGNQEDFTDCGILAANTAAHDIFNDPLWTVVGKVKERVQWFLTLSRAHMVEVNESAVDLPPYDIEMNGKCQPHLESRQSITHLLNPEPSKRTTIAHLLNPSERQQETSYSRPPMVMEYDGPSPLEMWSDDYVGLVSDTLDTQHMHGSETEESGELVVASGRQKKRAASVSDTESPRKAGKQSKSDTPGQVRKLKSSLWARIRNQQFASGDFVERAGSRKKFKVKISEIDEHSTVIDPKTVRHAKCGKNLSMKEPYNIGNFKSHVARCRGSSKTSKTPGGGMKEIHSYFQRQSQSNSPGPQATSLQDAHPSSLLPCPGLRLTEHSGIETYLGRTGAFGGGGSSVTAIAEQMYRKRFAKLSEGRKQQVRVAQMHEWEWRNDHENEAVYSVNCTKASRTLSASQIPLKKQKGQGKIADIAFPCHACLAVLELKVFKNALRVPLPDDNNYKYVPKHYRNVKLAALYGRSDSEKSPLVVYTQGVLSGKYRGNEMFGNLLQVLIVKHEKERKGVGMQNFKYTPDIAEFAHIIQAHSTRAYEALKAFLPLPSVRTLQLHRSRQPRFPVGIQDRTYSLVVDKLHQIEYDGPVALSCDDTKLLASFRPYYDADRGGYYLMGHVGEPFELPDPDAFRTVVNEESLQKATKLRLWNMQVPIHRIPPIIVAAVSIPENLSAAELFKYLWQIISGFLARGVKIASYASDGSTVERSIQHLLEAQATTTRIIPIRHGVDGQPDYPIKLHFFDKQPIAIIQDSKHLLKTSRNNVTSGARFLTFPGGVATYSQIEEMALAQDSPLYHRDVVKADRQDDNAATRLFSAAALQWLITHCKEQVGLIGYLFAFGELVDAYQNRSISLHSRVRLVLRAHYFIEIWEKFLNISKYPKARYYISPQCADITNTLVQGFLQALIIYRDFSGIKRPFLPWLLCTEVIEHVFGLCRQIVKDFTLLDFHYMVPKLFISLRQSVLSGKFSDSRERAAGYNHTYTDTRGIDLQALSVYPSKAEIDEESKFAYQEAQSLFEIMGLSATDLYTDDFGNAPTRLPSIGSWFDDFFNKDNDDLNEQEVEEFGYQNVMDQLEDADDLSPARDEDLQNYRLATIALSIQDHMNIAAMPMPSDADVDEANADDAAQITDVLSKASCGARTIVAVQDHKRQNPFMSTDASRIDLNILVNLRLEHQTRQASTSVRTSSTPCTTSETSKATTERQKILKEFSLIIREAGDRGVGSGLERTARWRGENVTTAPLAGNAANAAEVAKGAAKQALKRRTTIFQRLGFPKDLFDARINALTPLQVGSGGSGYGIIYSPTLNQVLVGKVLTLYSKSGGKNSRHNNVSSSPNIMGVSNIGLQVYERAVGSQFREIPHKQALGVKRFDFIPPHAFLCSLHHAPNVLGSGITISDKDYQMYSKLQSETPAILAALKDFTKRSRTTDVAEDE